MVIWWVCERKELFRKLVLKSIFISVWNKCPNGYFKKPVQIRSTGGKSICLFLWRTISFEKWRKTYQILIYVYKYWEQIKKILHTIFGLFNLSTIMILNCNGNWIASSNPKIQQTKMLVTYQRFGDLFLFGWSASTILIKKHSIKVGSNFKVIATYLQQ